jgi:hypothetical protein
MTRSHARRPPTPEENRARNIERILNPPGPTLSDRLWRVLSAVEHWWCRHVTQRYLYRLLDAVSAAAKQQRDTRQRTGSDYPGPRAGPPA